MEGTTDQIPGGFSRTQESRRHIHKSKNIHAHCDIHMDIKVINCKKVQVNMATLLQAPQLELISNPSHEAPSLC